MKPDRAVGRTLHLWLLVIAALLLGGSVLVSHASPGSQGAEPETPGWTAPVKVSSEGVAGDLPTIVADFEGGVHLFWTEGAANTPNNLIYYAPVEDGKVGRSNSVLYSPAGVIVLSAIADNAGWLHVAWTTDDSRAYYSNARIGNALAAPAWTPPRVVAGPVYGVGLVTDASRNLHLFYSNNGSPLVYQRISTDYGCSWSRPELVGEGAGANEGIFSIRSAVDEKGCLHLVWSQVDSSWWPGNRIYYTRSCDEGASWSEALAVDTIESGAYNEDYGPFLGNVAAVGDGKIVLVWDGAPGGQRHVRWSHDGGLTWGSDNVLDDTIRGIAGVNALATDSSGTLHLVTGGNTMQEGGAGIYYATWQDGAWSPLVMSDPLHGEMPEVTITGGNELHAIWTTHVRVYYQRLVLDTPQLPAGQFVGIERPCDEGVAAEPTTAEPAETPTAAPTAAAAAVDGAPPPATSSNWGLIGLLPVALLCGMVILARLGRMRRWR